MVHYRRNLVGGGTFFFRVTLADRRAAHLVDHVDTLRDAFRIAGRERPFEIDAVVILPDHRHAIFTLPPEDADFSGRWRRIKGYFSSALIKSTTSLRRHANGDLAPWEYTISDDRDFAQHVDYIHFNPVKHRLVSRVADWPHSSFHRFVREGILPEDWAGDADERDGDFGERGEEV
jgi:putative transposase